MLYVRPGAGRGGALEALCTGGRHEEPGHPPAATQRLRHIHSDVFHAACLFKLLDRLARASEGSVVPYIKGAFLTGPLQDLKGGPDDDFKMQEVMLTLCNFSAAFGCGEEAVVVNDGCKKMRACFD